MKEQIVFDLVEETKAGLWSSIEDSINEIPDIVARMKVVRADEDVEELLCILFEKLEVSLGYIRESAMRISALEDIEDKVKRKLPDFQDTLSGGTKGF